jgi:hypothetical protein
MARKRKCGVYMHNVVLAMEKNEIMPFAGKLMKLEIILLCKLSQANKRKYHAFVRMQNIDFKNNKKT